MKKTELEHLQEIVINNMLLKAVYFNVRELVIETNTLNFIKYFFGLNDEEAISLILSFYDC